MLRLLLLCLLALTSGCADCTEDGWSRWVGVDILGMPDNAQSATLEVTANALDVSPCRVVFGPSEDNDFADVVDESECPGTMAGFTSGGEWFVGYPVGRTFPRITVSFEVVDESGESSGFDDVDVRLDWSRSPFDNGLGCTGNAQSNVLLTQTGALGWLP